MITNEVEAWYELAMRMEQGKYHGNGLCTELFYMRVRGEISRDLEQDMYTRIDDHMGAQQWTADGDDFWGGKGSAYAFAPSDVDVRILAAYLLALEAADEEVA